MFDYAEKCSNMQQFKYAASWTLLAEWQESHFSVPCSPSEAVLVLLKMSYGYFLWALGIPGFFVAFFFNYLGLLKELLMFK